MGGAGRVSIGSTAFCMEGPMKAIIATGIAIQVWALLAAAPARAADPVDQLAGVLEELRETGPQTAPVELDGEILFWVVGAKSFPADDRARSIRASIVALARDPSVRPESVHWVDDKFATRIVVGERPIMHVVDADARIDGLRRQVVAEAHTIKIRSAIEQYRRDRSKHVLLTHALYAAVATAGALLGLWLALRAARRAQRAVEARYKARIHAVTIQSVEVIQIERVRAILSSTFRTLRWLVIVALLYVYFGFVLGLFPWTRLISNRLADFVLDPLAIMGRGLVHYLPNVAFLVILTLLIRWTLSVARLVFTGIERGAVKIAGFDADWAQPTYKIFRLLVVIFGLVVAYPYIPGAESPAFRGLSIFFGILVSLGSSSTIANIMAGYSLTYRRTFKVGDRVKIDDVTGDVVEVRLLVTHLHTVKNEEVIVANSKILSTDVVNYSSLARTRGLILHTTVGIGYETPWRQVAAMLRMAADRTVGLLKDPEPFVRQKALGDFAVTYELNAYCNDAQAMNALYSDMHRSILDVFNEYGVQIMTPAYEGDPEEPKVVPREHWYTTPAEERTEAGGASHQSSGGDRPKGDDRH
jgi:small-conductance mechanosensitive channel